MYTSYWLYSYLNLESTKTSRDAGWYLQKLYSYLNLESTKTKGVTSSYRFSCTVT